MMIGFVHAIDVISAEFRALVEFLGIENMLAIICSTESAAECVGVPHSAPENKGLFGYMWKHNLRISGRYRVIALTDESRYKSFLSLSIMNHQFITTGMKKTSFIEVLRL